MDGNTQAMSAFLDAVASERVAPAGGSVVALTGAAGTALVEKAVIHTLETNLADDSPTEELRDARSSINTHRSTLVSLATSDAQSVDDLFAGESGELDQTVLKQATGIPLSIANTCSTVLAESLEIITAVESNVAPDLHSGLYLLYSVSVAAIRTVESNLELIEDLSTRSQFEARKNAVIQELVTTVGALEAAAPIDFELSAE